MTSLLARRGQIIFLFGYLWTLDLAATSVDGSMLIDFSPVPAVTLLPHSHRRISDARRHGRQQKLSKAARCQEGSIRAGRKVEEGQHCERARRAGGLRSNAGFSSGRPGLRSVDDRCRNSLVRCHDLSRHWPGIPESGVSRIEQCPEYIFLPGRAVTAVQRLL